MFDIPKYEPVTEDELVLFEMSEAEKECSKLMQVHLWLSELRDKYDFSVPKSIIYPEGVCVDEGVSLFNSKVCSFVSVEDWSSERLEKEGVFPDCVCVDLDQYGNLPLVMYEVLKKVSVAECKDVLVGLPVWVMEENDEDKN